MCLKQDLQNDLCMALVKEGDANDDDSDATTGALSPKNLYHKYKEFPDNNCNSLYIPYDIVTFHGPTSQYPIDLHIVAS